jgi:aldehyde dehydrogenase (NAD+)
MQPSSWLPGTVPSVEYEARGVCLVFGPWNLPWLLAIEPTVAAVAAGNTVMLKPNSLTPATSAVVGEVIRAVFDEALVAVFEGGDDVADMLLEQPVDHIFFTGSPKVGRIVMAAAARHLASVTLELGGKCPAIVDGSHDLADSARLIGEGRHANGGQICFAVDHVWVKSDILEAFLAEYDAWVDAHLLAGGAVDPSAVTHIIDQRNTDRVLGLVDDARSRGARVLRGGGPVVGQCHLVEPTVILDAPLDSKVMTEEIFGPVLPIQTFDETGDLLRHVRSAPKPLALFVYSDDEAFVSSVLAGTSSGGVTVNGWGTHVSEPKVGFGGVNNSGSGRYHGVWGFREFSNPRAVVRHC